MATNIFKPIQQPNGVYHEGDSRSSSVMSSVTDNGHQTSTDNNGSCNGNTNRPTSKHRHRHRRDPPPHSSSNPIEPCDPKFLLRRSSSAMRVRELRGVLTSMTEKGNEEVKVSGSQTARLLVASQQRLVSRLQDLRHELDSMDNEVARVRGDIMNSRRYFSAMTGIPCGPNWPRNMQQMDSTYTSPLSFMSKSSDASPYNSDDSISTTATNKSSTPFQSLQQFEDLPPSKSGQLSRSDSCSSFLSWRSDVELAGVFPEEPEPLHVSPQKQFSRYNHD